MRKSKLSMLVIAGLCALGVSSFAMSSEGAGRQADGLADRAPWSKLVTGATRSDRTNSYEEPRRIRDEDRNEFGQAFERMQRNMDLMDAYFDKHFKKGQGQFRVEEAKSGQDGDLAKKRRYLDERMKDEKRRIIFSVSRKADLVDNQPLVFIHANPVAKSGTIKEGQPASERTDEEDRIPSAGPYEELSDDEIRDSAILDKLEQIPPVSLDKFEAWDDKRALPDQSGFEADVMRSDVNINLNEKTRELEQKNRNELPEADRNDPEPVAKEAKDDKIPVDVVKGALPPRKGDEALPPVEKDDKRPLLPWSPDENRRPFVKPDRLRPVAPDRRVLEQLVPKRPGSEEGRGHFAPSPVIDFDPVKLPDMGIRDRWDPVGQEKDLEKFEPSRRNP